MDAAMYVTLYVVYAQSIYVAPNSFAFNKEPFVQ